MHRPTAIRGRRRSSYREDRIRRTYKPGGGREVGWGAVREAEKFHRQSYYRSNGSKTGLTSSHPSRLPRSACAARQNGNSIRPNQVSSSSSSADPRTTLLISLEGQRHPRPDDTDPLPVTEQSAYFFLAKIYAAFFYFSCKHKALNPTQRLCFEIPSQFKQNVTSGAEVFS